MLRLFVGLPLPADLREAAGRLLADLRRAAPKGVAWSAPENLHVTLKFLGAVEADRLAEMKAAAASVAEGAPAFETEVAGLGAFPNAKRPRVIWLGCGEAPELRALERRAEDAFAALGFAREERPFHPHVTLGRVKDPGAGATALRRAEEGVRDALRLGRWRVTEVALFRSVLDSRGAAYLPLQSSPLQGAAAPGGRTPETEGSDAPQGSQRGR